MRTILTIERFKNGRRLERRQHPARSFVRGLFDLLYVAHAQLPESISYECTDIMLASHRIDGQFFKLPVSYYYSRQYKGTLALCAPSGGAGLFVPTGATGGDTESEMMNVVSQQSFVLGENLGIVIGSGATVVSPADRKLEEKFHHGQNAAIVAETKMESYEAGDDQQYTVYGNRCAGVQIIPRRGFRLTKVELFVGRTGSPGNCTLGVWGVGCVNYNEQRDVGARGAAITTEVINGNLFGTTPAWETWTLSTPVEIQPGMPYFIGITCEGIDSSNCVNLRYNQNNPIPDVFFALNYTSDITASEPEWNVSYDDWPLFRVYGTARAQFEYGAVDIFGYSVSDPNASFNIRRLFRNSSGGSLTVNECGMYACGCRWGWRIATMYAEGMMGWPTPICIARDIVSPGIVVANGEDLVVTYTPQITV